MGGFVIVGGLFDSGSHPKIATERCNLNSDKIRCRAIEPELQVSNPVMMSISHDFCQNNV